MFRDSEGNPKSTLSWLAPLQNVDGTDIDYELDYQLYINDRDEPELSFPGELNADGRYMLNMADVAALQAVEVGKTVFVKLTAIERNNPDRESEKSNAVAITRVSADPKAPTELSLDD